MTPCENSVAASTLYDGDVVQDTEGRVWTVLQQWHGADGLVARCITGAFRFTDAGRGFSYRDPVWEIGADEVVRASGSLEDDGLVSLGQLPGEPDRESSTGHVGRLVRTPAVDDLVILADGFCHRVVDTPAGPVLRSAWATSAADPWSGTTLTEYLELVEPSQRGFVVLEPQA